MCELSLSLLREKLSLFTFVHVAEREQKVVLLQVPQGPDRIAKGGPVPDCLAVPCAVLPVDGFSLLLGDVCFQPAGDVKLCQVVGLRRHASVCRRGSAKHRCRGERADGRCGGQLKRSSETTLEKSMMAIWPVEDRTRIVSV